MGDGRSRAVVTPAVVRLVAGHAATVVTEWASMIAVLVYAFDRGGASATGLSSLALLSPQVLAAPISASLTSTWPPRRLRVAGLVVQAGAYAGAAVAAAADAPVPVVAAAVFVALSALSTLRPTGAVLLPALVRSTGELTRGNLWNAHADSASALAGPLLAAGLLAAGGPPAALGGCAALVALAAGLSAIGRAVHPGPTADDHAWHAGRVLAGALDTLRTRPWTVGVLGVVTARSAVVGFLDVLLVVLAFDELGLGDGGPGLLSALVGGGALVSALVATGVVRRARLAPWLAVGLGLSATACLVLGLVTELGVAVVVLPVLGLASALIYGLGTMLLQRSADPRVLGSLFALVELVSGVGLLVGSGVAQLLIALGDVQVALVGMAVLLAVVLLVNGRAVWRADGDADVPVVEMSVLHALPMFAPLPPLELEAVARSSVPVEVADGEVVIRQGEPGDRFFAVADGTFDIVRDGAHIRTAGRGSCFGEVALLVDVPRTATVTADGPGSLLAVDREPFLVAMTGRGAALSGAWNLVQAMPVAATLPATPDVSAAPEPDEA